MHCCIGYWDPVLFYSALPDKSKGFRGPEFLLCLLNSWLRIYSLLVYVLFLQVTPTLVTSSFGYMSWSQMIIEGSEGSCSKQELKQKPWRNTDYWLAFQVLLSLLSYMTQDQLFRDGLTWSGPDPSMSVINQENTSLQASVG